MYITRLSQRLTFVIEWHHCASNIFLLLIKRLLLGDALATITDTMDLFCSDKNLVLPESQHLSQDLHLIPAFIVQINTIDWNVVFFKNKNHNYLQILLDLVDLSSLVVAISSPFRRIIAEPVAPFRTSHYTCTLRRTVAAHFVTPYPPHCAAPYPHILTHQVRTFRHTVPAHFVAPYHVVQLQNGVQLWNGVWLQNWIQFAKWEVQLRNGVQLLSMGKSEEDT